MKLRRLHGRPVSSSPGGRRVVVGVNFDEPSLATARWVARYFAPTAELVLVHVLPVPRAPAFLKDQLGSPDSFVEQVTPAMLGGLQGLASTLGVRRVTVEVRVGEPAEELSRAAVELGADMVCVGFARSRRGSARSGRNTVERLLRRLEVPLLQGSPGARPPERLMAAVDGGAGSDAILATAWSVAERLEAELDALHVLDADVRAYARAMSVAVGSAGEAEAAEQALWEAAAGWLRERLVVAGAAVGRSRTRVLSGEPGPEMLRVTAVDPVDLLVVGREGRDAVTPGLVGSTTRLLLAAAAMPLLVIPEVVRPIAPPEPDPDDQRSHRLWPARVQRSDDDTSELVDAGHSDGGWLPPAARRSDRSAAPASVLSSAARTA